MYRHCPHHSLHKLFLFRVRRPEPRRRPATERDIQQWQGVSERLRQSGSPVVRLLHKQMLRHPGILHSGIHLHVGTEVHGRLSEAEPVEMVLLPGSRHGVDVGDVRQVYHATDERQHLQPRRQPRTLHLSVVRGAHRQPGTHRRAHHRSPGLCHIPHLGDHHLCQKAHEPYWLHHQQGAVHRLGKQERGTGDHCL